ncbi:MAG TPA: hypothetical protein EYM28_05000 [Rhodospirillales bacterium]|nr:hypothetical protein [Rhodospirillales bacterium]
MVPSRGAFDPVCRHWHPELPLLVAADVVQIRRRVVHPRNDRQFLHGGWLRMSSVTALCSALSGSISSSCTYTAS